MTFTLTIELGNDAMQTPEDVAAVLRSIMRRLENYSTLDTASGSSVRDINGNTVGKWEVK